MLAWYLLILSIAIVSVIIVGNVYQARELRAPAEKVVKDLHYYGFETEFQGANYFRVFSNYDDWWSAVVTVKEDIVDIRFAYTVPKDHLLREHLKMGMAQHRIKMGTVNPHEVVNQLCSFIKEAEDAYDARYKEKYQEALAKKAPASWGGLKALKRCIDNLRDAEPVLKHMPKCEDEYSDLFDLEQSLSELYWKGVKTKHEKEREDLEWVKDPASGFLIGAVPLCDRDAEGTEDTWRGVVQDRPYSVRASSEEEALEMIKELISTRGDSLNKM